MKKGKLGSAGFEASALDLSCMRLSDFYRGWDADELIKTIHQIFH
jgi:hypothetical protein